MKRNVPDEELEALARTRSKDRWEWTHFMKHMTAELSGDLAYALAVKIMGIEELCAPETRLPTFTHMKLGSQGIPDVDGTKWTNQITWSLKDDLTLLVGNHVQRHPFHYVEKDWLSDTVLRKLERAAYE